MSEGEPLRLFVYGTLKRGFPARERFLAGTDAEEAAVSGELFALEAGYPAIVISEGGIVATGSGDFRDDLRRQSEVSSATGPSEDEPVVFGEIVQIGDEGTLREIDLYEGFDPKYPGAGEYRRVLIPARRMSSPRETLLVWAYAASAPSGIRLSSGSWDAP